MKNLFFGLAAVAVALSASAFTNANRALGSVYGSTSGIGTDYTLRTNPYAPTSCNLPQTKVCAYIVTAAGAATITDSSYTPDELEGFASEVPARVEVADEQGIYSGL
jgi:hypothetical protein